MKKKLLGRFIGGVFLAMLLILGYGYSFYYGYAPGNRLSSALIDAVYKFPEESGPKEISLGCDYHGEKLELRETLYQSTYNYYQKKPNKFNAYYSGNNKVFLETASEDRFFDNFSKKIKDIGVAKGLDSDQTLDLAGCFLQSIPYDQPKAQKILSDQSLTFPVQELVPRYPYETLYDGLGICTDKTYLGIAVFERLGYRTAILEFDDQRHMSIGVGVPSSDGNFNSDLGILELTNTGFKVGDVPELKSGAGVTVNNYQIKPNISVDEELDNEVTTSLSEPSSIEIVSGGRDYQLLGKRLALKQQIDAYMLELEKELSAVENAEKSLEEFEAQLSAAEARYKAEETLSSYRQYTNIYNQYLSSYNYAKSLTEAYNKRIGAYNKLLSEYHSI